MLDKGLVTLGGSQVRVSVGGGGGCNLGTRKPFNYLQAPLWQQYYAVWSLIYKYRVLHKQSFKSVVRITNDCIGTFCRMCG